MIVTLRCLRTWLQPIIPGDFGTSQWRPASSPAFFGTNPPLRLPRSTARRRCRGMFGWCRLDGPGHDESIDRSQRRPGRSSRLASCRRRHSPIRRAIDRSKGTACVFQLDVDLRTER